MKDPDVLSHWHHLVEDFQTSALDFYAAVEKAIARRNLPGIELSRVTWKEGGLATAKREYLRIRRGRFAFDICAAPYGSGFFFSWWLARIHGPGGLLALLFLLFGMFLVLSVVAGVIAQFVGQLAAVGAILLSPLGLIILGMLMREGTIPGEDVILEIPVFAWIYTTFFNPVTYYRLDTALMFQESVRNAVQEVIADLRSQQGLRAFSDAELEPKMRSLTER